VERCDGWLASRRSSHQPAGGEDHMRFIHLFLIGYFILIVGVGFALWQDGILQPCHADLAGHWRDRRGRPGNHAVGVVGEADGHRGVEEMTTLTLPAPIVLVVVVAFMCGAVGKALAGGALHGLEMVPKRQGRV
jgi:hypothetical protein